MPDWPLDDDAYREIRDMFLAQLRHHQISPLLEYLKRKSLDWSDLAPNPPFNRSVVSLWSSGKRIPSPSQIRRILAFNHLSEQEICAHDPELVRDQARLDTIRWIRRQWFSNQLTEPEPLTIEKLKALDLYTEIFVAQAFDTDNLAILDAIRKTYPKAEIWRIEDLIRLLDDWIESHAALDDMLIDEEFTNET
jgi:hypothetical protein